MQLTRIKSNGDAMFVLGEHERNRVEGENAGRLTNASKGGDGSSAPKEARLPLPSLRPRHRNRKGIPRRAPFF